MSKNQEVIDAYVREQLSLEKVAKKLGLTRWMVTKMLVEAGIELRSASEANVLAHAQADEPRAVRQKRIVDPQHRKHLIEVIDGLLLSDGHIEVGGQLSLGQTGPRRIWVTDVARELASIGITSTVSNRPPKTIEINGQTVRVKARRDLKTHAFDEIFAQRQRWYRDGVKIAPRDLVLTPKSVAYWLCGDGAAFSNGGLVFCTDNFTQDDVDFLRERLAVDLDVTNTNRIREKTYWRVHIGQRNEAVKLRDIIAPFVHSCFQYKFADVRPRMNSKVDWSKVDLGKRRDRDIARDLKIGTSTVQMARRARGIPAWRDAVKSKTEETP
jgi:hypothetical protein